MVMFLDILTAVIFGYIVLAVVLTLLYTMLRNKQSANFYRRLESTEGLGGKWNFLDEVLFLAVAVQLLIIVALLSPLFLTLWVYTKIKGEWTDYEGNSKYELGK